MAYKSLYMQEKAVERERWGVLDLNKSLQELIWSNIFPQFIYENNISTIKLTKKRSSTSKFVGTSNI